MMKKTMLILAATIMMATAASGQETQKVTKQKFDQTEMVKNQTDRMVKNYGLNETQAAQLLEVNTKFADKMPRRPHGNRGGMRGQRPQHPDNAQQARPSEEQIQARRAEMRANIEAYQAELKKIMTSEQYEKYTSDIKKRMESRSARGPQHS